MLRICWGYVAEAEGDTNGQKQEDIEVFDSVNEDS